MSAELLTGFFGKLPSAGDFVTRGLPVGFAAFWDGWATRHLVGRAGWPEHGLRLRLASGGRVAAGIVVPGVDRVGRRFPCAAFVIAEDLPAPDGLDDWCDAARAALLAAQAQLAEADALAETLENVAAPDGGGPAEAMQVWTKGKAPLACDAGAPEAALDQLFSCSGSLRP
jgi:type VI secretion system protein ImpM